MSVTLDKKVAQDLIETKIRVLDQKIRALLQRWKVSSVEDLIEGARSGTLEEAESDAIEVQNLSERRTEVEKLLQQL